VNKVRHFVCHPLHVSLRTSFSLLLADLHPQLPLKSALSNAVPQWLSNLPALAVEIGLQQ